MHKSPTDSIFSGRNFSATPKVVRERAEAATKIASNGKPATGADILPDKNGDSSSPNRAYEYMEQFVYNDTYAAPQVKYVTTEIAPDIEQKMRRILFCREKGRKCSLKAFINNVLAAHLEEYADVINQLKL